MRIFRVLVGLVLCVGILVACGSSPLLSAVGPATAELHSGSSGASVNISYTIGQAAKVSVFLLDPQGQRYILRKDEPRLASSDPYILRFDGTVPTDDPVLQRRALSSGVYTYVVEAIDANGTPTQAQGQIKIISEDTPPPMIENLVVMPDTISPNADAINDVAEITYQLPVTATVDIFFTSPDGTITYPFVANDLEGPYLQRQVWNGKTVDNTLLPDGVYPFTIRAQDTAGNQVVQKGQVAIKGGGQPEVKLTYSHIAPEAVMQGDVITVTMRVKNTGDVPIRTYGPPSGYEYSTDDVFSSIDNRQYVVKPGGFWRVGMDWDANSGGAAKRYPFRWAITPRPPEQWQIPDQEDLFMPGEEATIVGRIRVVQPETKMSFYVGLIQDGVGFFQDRTGRTIVKVGF